MHQITDTLKRCADFYNLEFTQEMLDKFEVYKSTLLEWNERINLTAITQPKEIAIKHFLDSILLLKAIEIPINTTIIDVGTGAGFPAIPIKIVRDDLKITLLDSLKKRVSFLTELSAILGQENTIIHGRAEEYGHDKNLRGKFDIATARAVASLPALCEYCLPFVKTGGYFAAMKSRSVHAEIVEAKHALSELGGEVAEIKEFKLPPDNKRLIIIIKKISQTLPIYPRKAVKITKKPL